MLLAAIRDLQYRRRRVLVAVLGASLVLALSLVMSGLSASFTNGADRTIRALQAERWAVPADASGPFSSLRPVPLTEALDHVSGAERGGVLVSRINIGTAEDPLDAIFLGVEPGRPGAPVDVDEGRPLEADGEVVLSSRFGFAVGDSVALNGDLYTVVGLVDATLLAGSPVAIVTLADAQRSVANGAPAVTAVALGEDATVDSAFRLLDSDQVLSDAVRPLADAERTISLVRTLLWLVAALIVGSVLYLNALERTADVAVFKAVGVRGASVVAGMFLQATIVALAASLVAIVVAVLLAPVFPMRVEIPRGSIRTLPLIALAMSFLGALAGVRRAVAISPALAFRGA
jgi:putative ABC transport system permease protein